jgi:hypothetical protein
MEVLASGEEDHDVSCRHRWRIDLRARCWWHSDELVLASSPERPIAAARFPGRPSWAASELADRPRHRGRLNSARGWCDSDELVLAGSPGPPRMTSDQNS